jgi:AAA domain/DnaB-like helicase N terminal domain
MIATHDAVRPTSGNGHPTADPMELVVAKVPPFDEDCELSCLGGLLLDCGKFAEIAGILKPEDFYSDPNQIIFRVISGLAAAGKPFDPVLVATALQERGLLADAGGCEYLHRLIETVPHSEHTPYYANKVAELARRRNFGIKCQHLALQARVPSVDFESLVADAAKLVEFNPPTVDRFTFRQMADRFPRLHKPIIDGLVRERETMNIVSVSKWGKSWLLHCLLLCVVTGRPWLGRFATHAGRVLLIDNELHAATLAHRIKTVADAMQISADEYADTLEVWPLRGKLQDIFAIGRRLETFNEPFSLIAIDAKYRATSSTANENDNASEAMFYNEADRIAEKMGSTLALVHHSSKGNQSEKRLVDVGAGAGAQSRAADCHLILREHEENGAAVLEAAVRSFAPVEPIGLRWIFPLWTPDEGLNVGLLKGRLTKADETTALRDAETNIAILDACQTWRTRAEIRKATGYGDGRANRGIARLLKTKLLERGRDDRPRNPGSEVFRKTIHAN